MEYRGYSIEGDGTFGMKVIKYPGRGGTIPQCLEGAFTKAKEAMYAIDQYLLIKEERDNKPEPIKKVKLTPREVKEDGSAEGTSGD
jgi:hypothetical protein